MEKPIFEGPLKEAFIELQRYIDLQFQYNKIVFTKKLGDISSYFVLLMLLLGIGGFAMLFFSFSFVNWYEEAVGSRYHASLLVTLFYVLLAIVVILFRNKLLFNPIKKLLGSIIASDEEGDSPINPLESQEVMQKQLSKYKKAILEEQQILQEKMENLGSTFTINSIVKSVTQSFYDNYVTTANVAKVAFSIFGRIKGSFFGKSKKKNKSKAKLERRDD